MPGYLETSSPINYLNYTIIDSPSEISQRAYKFAQLYEQEDTFYHWGGQEPLRSAIGIDCSGLVVMCYKYAMVDTGYKLIQEDMTFTFISNTRLVNLEKLKISSLS